MDKIRKVISLIVINESSTLSRISGLFAGRGYNIESLTVSSIKDSDNMSYITIVTKGNEKIIEQISKQLNKLISVYKVIEHENIVEKEMLLVKFSMKKYLADIKVLAEVYNGRVVNISSDSIIVMVADHPTRIKYFIEAAKQYNPIEIISSGVLATDR